jgi:hypothetical protein
MARLALQLKSLEVTKIGPEFFRLFYKDVLLDLDRFRGAAHLSELQEIFPEPEDSGITVEFGGSRIVLRADDVVKCVFDGRSMLPFQPFVILPTQVNTLVIGGKIKLQVSAFIC